jgi:hypothetical protein
MINTDINFVRHQKTIETHPGKYSRTVTWMIKTPEIDSEKR